MLMPFGKHRGKHLENVPHNYLWWVLENACSNRPVLKRAIETFLGLDDLEGFNRKPKTNQPSTDTRKIISSWHKKLCLRWHPDRNGGDTRIMQALNDAVDLLLKEIK